MVEEGFFEQVLKAFYGDIDRVKRFIDIGNLEEATKGLKSAALDAEALEENNPGGAVARG